MPWASYFLRGQGKAYIFQFSCVVDRRPFAPSQPSHAATVLIYVAVTASKIYYVGYNIVNGTSTSTMMDCALHGVIVFMYATVQVKAAIKYHPITAWHGMTTSVQKAQKSV